MIPFNKPFNSGNELDYIKQSVTNSKISGDGSFTAKCHEFFESKFGFGKVLLTTSCTDALEMAAILLDIKPGDEVIAPSYTFVSTVNAFKLRGAKIVFADSRSDHPGIDENSIEALITPQTKVIVPVHYAGVACDMQKIMTLAKKHKLSVVEDAAQAIDSYFIDSNGEKSPLGTIGDLAAFSFHETKNVISGEGGMLAINNIKHRNRAEIIREKGTNRSAFFRGEIDKYGWVDIGSSFLPSDIIAAFLFAQLEKINTIQKKRKELWNSYMEALTPLQQEGFVRLPFIPDYATNNAHMFYLICKNLEERSALIADLKAKGIYAVFHYQSLHKSSFYLSENKLRDLPLSDFYTNTLVRLPFYFELTIQEQEMVCNAIRKFFKKE